MRIVIISFSIITLSLSAIAQSITELHINIHPNTHARKKPSKKGFKKYKLVYLRDFNDNLTLERSETQFSHSNKTKNRTPKNSSQIKRTDVLKLEKWIKSNKKSFLIEELNIQQSFIDSSKNKRVSSCQPKMKKLKLIRVDSFNYCKQYPMRAGFMTGWDEFYFNVLSKKDTLFSFNFTTNDIISNQLNLKGYLTFQPFLNIPEGFEVADIFSDYTLEQVLKYYATIEQCEGYYYSLFQNEHPERTTLENAKETGWCFKEYLAQQKQLNRK